MRHLLNTLYVTTDDTYLSLDNDNIVINRNDEVIRKLPLRMFEQILYFGYKGASPALLGACAKQGISMCFYKPSGRFLARVAGNNNRKLQNELLKIADLEKDSLRFYNLGAKYDTKIEHFGAKEAYDPQAVMLF